MNVDFLEPAARELYEAIVFYDIQKQGLGKEFSKKVEDTIDRIKENPEAWATISSSKKARRCLTNRFPYGIIYQIRPGKLLIVAVWHCRRRPQAWQHRLSAKNDQ